MPSRPYAPGYGIPSNPRGMLPWSFVEERMSAARNYWVATVLPTGGPHLTPVWGLWVEGVFYFGSGAQTRKARNLAANPNVAVHPESEDVVIIEGVAEALTGQCHL
jgi:nitroimidazol reductase NimA-like FMN-containing flavoprotein (pyridoxamine 5'-phosphate oxidase superfamily)